MTTGAAEPATWREAFERLRSSGPSCPEEWTALAVAAYLTRPADWDRWCERAFEACVAAGDRPRAARCGFWLGFGLLDAGDGGRGGGWLARAGEALDQAGVDCAERGLLLAPAAVGRLEQGDAAAALELFTEIRHIGDRFGDLDVATVGCLGRAQSLVELGDHDAGLPLLDEAMVAVGTGSLSPPVAGLVLCAAIATCQRILDVVRAREWTSALSRWCDAHPDLVPYRGQCLVHRAQVLRLHGAWPDAVTAADAACAELETAPAAGDAWYERAELHRLAGELDAAEAAYRAASRAGRDPQPGLALLRLAQGDVGAAAGAIRRVRDEAASPVDRARALGPFVEIALAAGDVAGAREAADELARGAGELGAPALLATAASCAGAVRLAEGDAAAAVGDLRRAWRLWSELGAPFEAAQVRLHVAHAYAALGDADGAEMELDAARWVLVELGVPVDAGGRSPDAGPLTPREVEVLRLVARGRTNREAAAEMFISEKTVARHLSNVFAKLGVRSRAAATAWAYEQGVLGPPA
ncbi:MAG TPA: LuxR C-terminal-related transcriptional regulator [Acidimicrobiales bacterium]|nr:LuxR C-terminal-related transcriptional regulator [Acidimicrobiales bacterium]